MIKTAKLKVDKPTFAFIETVSNVVLGVVSGFTPSQPWEIAAKVIVIGAWNAALVWVGVESGDIPAST